MHENAEMHTPYGATEALPIASIESRMILEETGKRAMAGAGTCVGSRFPAVDWKVIAIDDGPLMTMDSVRELPQGSIGELMVRGPMVTQRYVTRLDQNALHKVRDGDQVWHRMGDVGYLDDQGRFWFCGRKSHRVRSGVRTFYTEPCEAIVNGDARVHRSALVGVGSSPHQTPVMIVEPWPEHFPRGKKGQEAFLQSISLQCQSSEPTVDIHHFLLYAGTLPTDIRHNSKIFREKLAPWAAERIPISKTSR